MYMVVTKESSRVQQRLSRCPTCRYGIYEPPRPPPPAFIDHLEQIKQAHGDGEGGKAGSSSSSSGEQIPQEVLKAQYEEQLAYLQGLFRLLEEERPLRDDEDNCDRCPRCHWEVVEGSCTRCDYRDDTYDTEGEEEVEDGEGAVVDLASSEDDEEGEDEEEEEEEDHDSFIAR